MANAGILKEFILSYEGGYVNDKDDRGGATCKGVTLSTYRSVFGQNKTVSDLKSISDSEWLIVFKRYFWDKCMADALCSQSIANLLVDFAWASGTVRAIKKVQGVVGTKQDGIMGSMTLAAINGYKTDNVLFDKFKEERIKYIESIAVGTQSKFRKGWLRRVNAISFGSLKCNGGKVLTW